MKQVKAIHLSEKSDGFEIGLVNQWASMLRECGATVLKRLIREEVPGRIYRLEAKRRNSQIPSSGDSHVQTG
jgi:hypothetical protein